MVLELFFKSAAAFLETVGLCILFHAPVKQYAVCGLTGVLGWIVYDITGLWVSDTVAAFFAALIIALAARFFAVWRKVPSNMFIISGIFPVIPGLGIYNMIYELMNGSGSAALSIGLDTFKVIIAMVLGIVGAFIIPNEVFSRIGKKMHPAGGGK